VIIKERKYPINILKLEALIRRLPYNYPKPQKIEEELAKSLAGYRGEQSVDYHLTFLPNKKYLILHALRLPGEGNRYFQLDTLILSSRFFLILEVKNFLGTLYFDQTFHQLIRTANGKEEAFQDPILQVRRQQQQLNLWLTKHKVPSIPIVPLIVISNPSTIIKAAPQHEEILQNNVIHAATLPLKFELLEFFTKRKY
jgi:hypothetical protein